MREKVEFFSGPHAIKDPDLVSAGGATSGAVDGLGQVCVGMRLLLSFARLSLSRVIYIYLSISCCIYI